MKTHRRLTFAFAVLSVVAAGSLRAQDSTFEVASVKRNTSGTTQANAGVLPNGVNFVNLPLRGIIQIAFQINQPTKVIGAPDWTVSERFDITARTADKATPAQIRPMLQNLLRDRFKLAAHMEMRDVTAYVLVPAKPDGKLGPQIHVSTADCAGPAAGAAPTTQARCGPRPGGPGKLILVGSQVSLLANIVSIMLSRPIVDKSGLTGLYDIELSYAPPQPVPAAGANVGANLQVEEPGGPSIFTALQEQLGLKLENGKTQEEVLVIEHVERPTEN